MQGDSWRQYLAADLKLMEQCLVKRYAGVAEGGK